eukprot:TRINITY_DN2059_c0_g1_i3.p1 TRINITY_DN2059_c0_g1~~TRINITY_DN2059_c0_g1_i3.p1  ORF type:complete len:257 (-),score=59.72 TRINITY_DN2059_c0_g1_i3:207-977(-)
MRVCQRISVKINLVFFFFFSSRRRHTRCREVSWARRCVQETGINAEYMGLYKMGILCCKPEEPIKKSLMQSRIEKRQSESKIVLRGQSEVGKSAIVEYALHQEFSSSYTQTIGGGDTPINILLENRANWKLRFVEIAGSPTMQRDLIECSNDGDAYLIIYDVNDAESLKKAEELLIYTNKNALSKKLLYLVANKIDKCTSLESKKEDGQEKATKHNAIFYTTSAKTGENILKLTKELAERLSEKKQFDQYLQFRQE